MSQSLGSLLKSALRKQQKIAAAEAKLRKEKEELEKMKSQLLEMADAAETMSVNVGTALGYVQEKEYYQVEDSAAFFKYVRRNNAFDLMQQRPAQRAIAERFQMNGRLPPGITTYHDRKFVIRSK